MSTTPPACVLLFFAVLLLCGGIHVSCFMPNTVFLSPVGSDANNCSIHAPCKTIARGLSMNSSRILFCPGTYLTSDSVISPGMHLQGLGPGSPLCSQSTGWTIIKPVKGKIAFHILAPTLPVQRPTILESLYFECDRTALDIEPQSKLHVIRSTISTMHNASIFNMTAPHELRLIDTKFRVMSLGTTHKVIHIISSPDAGTIVISGCTFETPYTHDPVILIENHGGGPVTIANFTLMHPVGIRLVNCTAPPGAEPMITIGPNVRFDGCQLGLDLDRVTGLVVRDGVCWTKCHRAIVARAHSGRLTFGPGVQFKTVHRAVDLVGPLSQVRLEQVHFDGIMDRLDATTGAFHADSVDHLTLSEVRFTEHPGHAVSVANSQHVTLDHVELVNNTWTGSAVDSPALVSFLESRHIVWSHVNMSHNRFAHMANGDPVNMVHVSRCHNIHWSSVTLSHNAPVAHNGGGVNIHRPIRDVLVLGSHCAHWLFHSLRCESNLGPPDMSVLLKKSSDVAFSQCHFEANERQALTLVENEQEVTLTQCHFIGNRDGISSFDTSVAMNYSSFQRNQYSALILQDVFYRRPTLHLSHVRFVGNLETILFSHGPTILQGCTFEQHHRFDNGLITMVRAVPLLVDSCEFSLNHKTAIFYQPQGGDQDQTILLRTPWTPLLTIRDTEFSQGLGPDPLVRFEFGSAELAGTREEQHNWTAHLPSLSHFPHALPLFSLVRSRFADSRVALALNLHFNWRVEHAHPRAPVPTPLFHMSRSSLLQLSSVLPESRPLINLNGLSAWVTQSRFEHLQGHIMKGFYSPGVVLSQCQFTQIRSRVSLLLRCLSFFHMEDCTLDQFHGAGLSLATIRNVTLHNVIFTRCNYDRFQPVPFGKAALVLTFVQRANLTEVKMIGNRRGLCARQSNETLMDRCTFGGNWHPGQGGAIQIGPGCARVRIERSVFLGNNASQGGAISSVSPLRVSHCHFAQNSAAGLGGSLALSAPFQIEHSVVLHSRALSGGSLYADSAATRGAIAHTLFANSSATLGGGALALMFTSQLTLHETRILHARSRGPGGAVLSYGSAVLEVTGGAIRHCRSVEYGGALAVIQGQSVRMDSVQMCDNRARYRGGALVASSTHTLSLHNLSFHRNTAQTGGALFTRQTAQIHLAHSNATHNSAAVHGGFAFLRSALHLEAERARVMGNEAGEDGGAFVLMEVENARLAQSDIGGNRAGKSGGAVWGEDVIKCSVDRVRMQGNEATQGGALCFGEKPKSRKTVLRIAHSTLAQNKATQGGALFGGHLVLDSHNTSYTQNYAAGSGGALYLLNSFSVLSRDTVDRNVAARKGGGLYVDQQASTGQFTLNATRVLRNAGGGLVLQSVRALICNGSAIEGNLLAHASGVTARDSLALGAGIHMVDSALALRGASAVRHNLGGGIALLHSSLDALHADLESNPTFPYARNLSKEVGVFCRGGSVRRDPTTKLSWLLCDCDPKCHVENGTCGIPPPVVAAVRPASGSLKQLERVVVTGTNMLGYRPACRLVAAAAAGDKPGKQASPRVVPARFVSRTQMECAVGMQANGHTKWFLAVSNDGKQWSTRSLQLTVAASQDWIWILALILGIALVAAGLVLFFLLRYRRLKRLSRIEMNTFDRKISHVDLEKLKVLRRIGVGSCGEVFLGSLHGTQVAVKRLFPLKQVSAQDEAGFQHEVSVLRTLRHPNIVLLIGATTAEPLLIVTEYMERGTLMELLASSAPLSLAHRVRMALDAARGMNYLHTLQPPIIHRDLKSPNLLVGKDYSVKVADFGMSRLTNDEKTMTACGTPAWTAPELLAGNRYSLKADVYSFGIVLYELYTRQPPYPPTANPMQVVFQVVQGHRPPLPPSIPAHWEQLLHACWAHEPQDRPSFQEIITRLGAFPMEHQGASPHVDSLSVPLLGSVNE